MHQSGLYLPNFFPRMLLEFASEPRHADLGHVGADSAQVNRSMPIADGGMLVS